MRKTKAIAFAAIAVGLLAGPATAGTGNEYRGGTKGDSESYVGFDTTKGKVGNLQTYLTYDCRGGEGGQAPVFGKGKLEIQNGKFEGKLKGEPSDVRRGKIQSATLEIAGKFLSKDKAKGTIKGVVKLADDSKCRTGELDWKAETVQISR